jgi:predicted AAA+ superfamily ATPase
VEQVRELVPRKAAALVAEALAESRVVTLNGARQTGKRTLARLAARQRPGALTRLLDHPATLRAARDDPATFVEHDDLLVIDEVQLAPELFRTIKVAVDTDQRPGQFLLTGSAQILALRDLPDALPGRMEIIELGRSPRARSTSPRWVRGRGFTLGPGLARTSTRASATTRPPRPRRLPRGRPPDPRRRAAFFESYLTSLIERGVAELAAIERRGDLRRLLARWPPVRRAARPGPPRRALWHPAPR